MTTTPAGPTYTLNRTADLPAVYEAAVYVQPGFTGQVTSNNCTYDRKGANPGELIFKCAAPVAGPAGNIATFTHSEWLLFLILPCFRRFASVCVAVRLHHAPPFIC